MIVVDASVVVAALTDDDSTGTTVRARLRDESLAAPHLLDLEVTAAWRRLAAGGQLDQRRIELAFADLGALSLRRVPHRGLLARCWELRDNLTIYDAVYVALAERLQTTLVTADRRLAGATGTRCAIETLA